MYTDYSKVALQTVCRLITMGTVLERMDEGDPDALVINRLPLHNYAVYLPVRNEDGSYWQNPRPHQRPGTGERGLPAPDRPESGHGGADLPGGRLRLGRGG